MRNLVLEKTRPVILVCNFYGHEMDAVRSIQKDLEGVQKWSQDLKDYLSTIESWMNEKYRTSLKVPLNLAQDLIDVDPFQYIFCYIDMELKGSLFFF